MVSSTTRYGTSVVILLVVLRLAIGWHFFKEGEKKVQAPEKFSSRHFLGAAKGPFAPLFASMIADRWGHARLNLEQTEARLSDYHAQVVRQFRFDDGQKKKADAALKDYKEYAQTYFAEKQSDIDKYFLEVERFEKASSSAQREDMPYTTERVAAKQTELNGQAGGWYAELGRFQTSFVNRLQRIAAEKQSVTKMPPFPDPSRSWVDKAVTVLVFGVGILLILGLFTRLAALGGAAFLASVIATQPFWVAGTEPTYYQVVEFLALLLLCASAAGQFAGLDYFVNALWGRCCTSNTREKR